MCTGNRPTMEEKKCTNPNCPIVVSKVEQVCVGPQCPAVGDSGHKNLAAKESALATAILIGAASLMALLRIYLFDT